MSGASTAETAAKNPDLDQAQGYGRALVLLGRDLVLPLVLFYGLRLLGVGVWVAVMVGAGVSVAVLVVGVVVRRRIEPVTVFVLSLIFVGTGVGLVTADARLLLARGSWVTVVVGLWFLGSLLAARPLLFGATLKLMPPAAAAGWRQDWEDSPRFRRLLRGMTLAFGLAFLADSAARIVMAYTLALDLVPLFSNLLLVVMLSLIVLVGKAIGRRLLDTRSL